jgi:hypothetical protein
LVSVCGKSEISDCPGTGDPTVFNGSKRQPPQIIVRDCLPGSKQPIRHRGFVVRSLVRHDAVSDGVSS